jgi:hypothetical protein
LLHLHYIIIADKLYNLPEAIYLTRSCYTAIVLKGLTPELLHGLST